MKAVMAQGVLALLGLLVAYRTWTHEEKDEPAAPGQVTISECAEPQLSQIEIESPTHTIVYKAKKGKQGTEYWITSQRKLIEPKKPESAKADADKDKDKDKDKNKETVQPASKNAKTENAEQAKAGEAAKPPEKPKVARPYDPNAPVTFLANKKFDDTLKSLAPLRAMRGIGEVPKKKLPDFGFDKVGTYLRVTCGGKKLALDVGGRTYGLADAYVRDPHTKQVYLLNGQLLIDLQSAQFKFMQTDLHNFPLTEIDEVVVKADGKERRLLHRNRLNPEDARWVDAAAPDKRNELFGNWFQRLERLRVRTFLDEGKEPGSDLKIDATAAVPVMTLEYKLEGKKKGSLELVRVDTGQGGFYYARTEATHRWVTMYDSLAKQIDEDLAMVVGAEDTTEAAPMQSTAPESSAPAASGSTPAAGGAPHPTVAPHPKLPHAPSPAAHAPSAKAAHP